MKKILINVLIAAIHSFIAILLSISIITALILLGMLFYNVPILCILFVLGTGICYIFRQKLDDIYEL